MKKSVKTPKSTEQSPLLRSSNTGNNELALHSKRSVFGLTALLFVSALVVGTSSHRTVKNTKLQNDGALPELRQMHSDTNSSINPHIVFVLLDDVGFNDMLDQSTDIKEATPYCFELATNGVVLTRYYAETDCTPGRTAFLTGKYPFTSGMQHSMVYEDSTWGLSRRYTLIGESLHDLGYSSHMVGKWDIGHYARPLWPTERGFSSYFGLIQTAFDYNYHTCCYFNHTSKHYGVDLHDGFDNADDESFSAKSSTYLFGNKSVELIAEHKAAKSLFLYVAFNAAHSPVKLPFGYHESSDYKNLQKKLNLTWSDRKIYAGTLHLVDKEIEKIVRALKHNDMYSNSVLIVTSDNGAPSRGGGGLNGGSSWPLRGYKGDLFDGALRVPAFIHSTLIPEAQWGKKMGHLFHVTDWFKTMTVGIASGDDGIYNFSDGYNQWDYILGTTQTSPRSEIPIHMDYTTAWGGIIVQIDTGFYKIVKQKCSLWYDYTDGNVTIKSDDVDLNCTDEEHRMYDLLQDPIEAVNLIYDDDYKTQRDTLQERFCHYYESDKVVDSSYNGRNYTSMYNALVANDWYVNYWLDKDHEHSTYPKADYWNSSKFCRGIF